MVEVIILNKMQENLRNLPFQSTYFYVIVGLTVKERTILSSPILNLPNHDRYRLQSGGFVYLYNNINCANW